MKNAVDTRVMAAQEEVRPGKSVYFCMIAGALVAFAGIWGFPYAEQVVGTITAVDTFLGVLLGISSSQYNKKGGL